jgi:hypothetical protein
MSQRHRNSEFVPPSTVDVRAHARGDRNRINSELHLVTEQLSAGLEPDDVLEPANGFKPNRHHDADKGKSMAAGRPQRHWKVKDWKRRTNQRLARIRAQRLIIEQS